MRLVSVNVPKGLGGEIVKAVLEAGVPQVAMRESQIHRMNAITAQDVVEFECEVPLARAILDKIMEAPFFDPNTCSLSVRQIRAIVSRASPGRITVPFVAASVEIYEELWQFCHITRSLVVRAFVAAVLLSYGMIENYLPMFVSGLLFLSYNNQLVAVAFGLWTKEWQLVRQGVVAFLVNTFLIVFAGICVATVAHPPMLFDLPNSFTSSFLIAFVIGFAAAFASADDSGRKELIGLAVAAHLAILPAWLGVSLVFDPPTAPELFRRLGSFFLNTISLVTGAGTAFAMLQMRGNGLRRFQNLSVPYSRENRRKNH